MSSKEKVRVIVCALSTLWICIFFYLLTSTHNQAPYLDDWDFIYFNEQIEAGTHTLADWIEQYYGAHRPAFTKGLMYIEYKIFNGKGIFTTTLSLFLVLSSAILIIKSLYKTDADENTKLFLLLIGIILVFNPAQLPIVNSQTHGAIRTPIVFLLFLSICLLSNDYHKNGFLSWPSVAAAMALASCALFSDLFGIFILAGVLITTFIVKTPIWLRVVCVIYFSIVSYYFIPGSVILYTDTGRVSITEADFLNLLNQDRVPFFPGYFIFLFGYFGAIACSYSHMLGVILGAFIFSACGIILILTVIKKDTRHIFFSILLLVFFMHGIAASLGRYQETRGAVERFYIFNCWILWIVCICLSRYINQKKYLYGIGFLVPVLFLSYKQINTQYTTYIEFQKADINIINGSFYHDAYKKISFPHILVDYNPIARYDKYLRNRKWGLYSSEAHPPLDNISADHCEAIKLHEFIVSGKAFYELKLDGWNITHNRYLPEVYALDTNGNIIARGKSILKEPHLLPLSMLPREKMLIYMIIPRTHPLKDITLVGGDDRSLCKIELQKKSVIQKSIY